MRSCIKCGRIWCFLTDQAWWRSRRTTLILRPCRSIRHNPMVRESTLSTREGRWQIKYIFEVLAPPKKVQKMLAPSILLPLWLSDNNIRGANVFWIDFGGTSTTKFLICYRPTAFIDIIENLRVYDFFNLVLRSTDRNSSRSNFCLTKYSTLDAYEQSLQELRALAHDASEPYYTKFDDLDIKNFNFLSIRPILLQISK